MAVDMALSYGGAVQFTANGDLAMVQDSSTSADATRQRIEFAILTNPRLRDANGNVIGSADDPFHPDYGAGIRALIGEAFTQVTIDGIRSRITQALALDPYVSSSPAPTITVTQSPTSRNGIIITVSAFDVTGKPVVLPPFDLSKLSIAG